MTAAVAALDDLRTEIERLERENKQLRRDLRDEEERAKDAEDERDQLQREVDEYESHERKYESANRWALAHARNVLESLVDKVDADLVAGHPVSAAEAFVHSMNRRALDAITELIGR